MKQEEKCVGTGQGQQMELFVPRPKFPRYVGKEVISVRRNGRIGIGKKLMAAHGIGKKPYVQLYFDKQFQQIGMRFLEDEVEGAVKITRVSATGREIRRPDFVNAYGIPTGEYKLSHINEGLMVFTRKREME